jgi:hypothetical protein
MLFASTCSHLFSDMVGRGMGIGMISFIIVFICVKLFVSKEVKDAARKAVNDKALEVIKRLSK